MGKCISKRVSRNKEKTITDRWKCSENGTFNIHNHGIINFYVGKNKKFMKKLAKNGANVFFSESGDFTNCLCKSNRKCEEVVIDSETNPIEEQPKSERIQNSAFSHLDENTFGQDLLSSGSLVSEDISACAEKFQNLQDDTESYHSSVEMQEIKEVSADFSENPDQSSGINISEGFFEDVHKNVDVVKQEILDQFSSEEVQRQRNSQNKNFDIELRKRGSVNSGLNFSILSEQRPWCPADGEAASQTYVNENCNIFDRSIESSTQVKYSSSSCSRQICYVDGSDIVTSINGSFPRSVTGYTNYSLYSSTLLTSEDDKMSSSSDFCGNKIIFCLREGNKRTEEKVFVGKHSPGKNSLPLPSLGDSEKSISQGYKIGSYRQSLGKRKCKDFINNDAEKDGSETANVKDSCQVLVSSNQSDVCKELIEETESDGFDDQADVHQELIEESESDGFDETFIEIIEKILEVESDITLTLRDISFSIYSNFIVLKVLSCKPLNYVQVMIVDCELFSITGSIFGFLYFHKSLLAVDKAKTKYQQKSFKSRSNEPNVADTIYTNNNDDPGFNTNDLKNVHAVVLPDSAGEQMDRVKHDAVAKSFEFINDWTDKCGNTCVLLEHEEHAKQEFCEEKSANCCADEALKIEMLSNSHKAEKDMKDTKEFSCHADQSKYSAYSKHDRDGRKGRLSGERKGKKILKRRPKFTYSEESSDSSFIDTSLTENESVENNCCCYCNKSLDKENKNCKHHKKIRHSAPELKEDKTSELVPEVRDVDSGITSLPFSCSLSTLTSLSKVKSKKNRNKKTALKKIIKQIKMGKIMLRERLPSKKLKNVLKDICAREHSRQIAKEVARVIRVDHRTLPAFGLGSYFDRLNNGPPLTLQEQMQYEWLRLATFSNYIGRGNALALARNGFYHDSNERSTSTRCYLCNAHNSNWEMLDDVSSEHRRQSPNCPFHSSSEQDTLNISISSGDSDRSSVQTSTSDIISTSNNATETLSVASLSLGPAVNEATRSLERTQTSLEQTSNREGESIPQQPTEEPENRDRSLLALPKPRGQQSLGRPGHSYSTVMAPKRNNIAVGAKSNVGLETAGNGPEASQASQLPGIRPSSILGGPVGAGAFGSNPNLTGLSTSSQVPVSMATEAEQASSAVSASASAGGTGPSPGTGRGTDHSNTVVVENPKHPDYRNIDTRISSYQGWPDYLDQTARQMAEAGFFFVGVADFTRCFCCGGGLRNWEPGDDPMLEHTRWFPRCEYVNKLKGEAFVAAVQRRHQEHTALQHQQQIEMSQRRDQARNPPDPMTTDAAATLQEMGYSAERTREAILAVRQQTGSAEVSTQQVLTWLLDDEERRLNASTETSTETFITGASSVTTQVPGTVSSTAELGVTTSEAKDKDTDARQTGSSTTEAKQTGAVSKTNASSGSASADKQSEDSDESKSAAPEDTTNTETSSKPTKKKNGKKKSKIKAGIKTEAAGATGRGLDAKSLKAENEKLREMQTCKICMEQPVNTTLLPCGHLVCCASCASRLQRCPICRKRIKGTVKTFMS